MFARIRHRFEKQVGKAVGTVLFSVFVAASPSAFAGSVNLTFTGTVGSVQNGIGLSGDQTITTTTLNNAAVRFELHNPGKTAKDLTLHTFDADFWPIEDIRLAQRIRLAPGQRRSITALVPVDPGAKRRFRICAADRARRHCGKFIARRIP
ncbi:MAG: hypothetical protein AAF940_03845 [Pseudomonadota bacterium]